MSSVKRSRSSKFIDLNTEDLHFVKHRKMFHSNLSLPSQSKKDPHNTGEKQIKVNKQHHFGKGKYRASEYWKKFHNIQKQKCSRETNFVGDEPDDEEYELFEREQQNIGLPESFQEQDDDVWFDMYHPLGKFMSRKIWEEFEKNGDAQRILNELW